MKWVSPLDPRAGLCSAELGDVCGQPSRCCAIGRCELVFDTDACLLVRSTTPPPFKPDIHWACYWSVQCLRTSRFTLVAHPNSPSHVLPPGPLCSHRWSRVPIINTISIPAAAWNGPHLPGDQSPGLADASNMYILMAGRTYQDIRNVSFSEHSCLSCPLKSLSWNYWFREVLLEGDPLPGSESGLLSNTRKWAVRGDTCTDKTKGFIGKGRPGGEQ